MEAREHTAVMRNGPQATAADMGELQLGGLRLKRKVEGFDHVWSSAIVHFSIIRERTWP